jgi:hypothetical protein
VVGGHPEGNPGGFDLALGADQPLRHVASPTRNARAISAVLRLPRVRSVSATCASVVSAG